MVVEEWRFSLTTGMVFSNVMKSCFFFPGKSSVYTWWLIVLTYSIHSSSTRVSSLVIYGVGGMVTWYRLVRESHEQYVLKTRPVHPMHFRVGTSSFSLKMKSYWSGLGRTQFDKVLLVTNCIGLAGISCSWLSPSFTGCRPVRVAYYDLLLHKWYFSNLMGGRNLVRDWEDEIFSEVLKRLIRNGWLNMEYAIFSVS